MAGNDHTNRLQVVSHHEGIEWHYPSGLEVDPPGLEASAHSSVAPDIYWQKPHTQESSALTKKAL